jgi:hypothetical protein
MDDWDFPALGNIKKLAELIGKSKSEARQVISRAVLPETSRSEVNGMRTRGNLILPREFEKSAP